jgi:predicted Zn-dependent protease
MPTRLEQFRNLVAQQPENELFRFSLAQALAEERQFEEARPHYEFCARKKPDWMMAHIGLAKALLQLSRRAEARPVLETALHLAIEQHHEDPERELRALLADW